MLLRQTLPVKLTNLSITLEVPMFKLYDAIPVSKETLTFIGNVCQYKSQPMCYNAGLPSVSVKPKANQNTHYEMSCQDSTSIGAYGDQIYQLCVFDSTPLMYTQYS